MEGASDWDAPPYPSDDSPPLPDRYSDADVGHSSPASSNYSSCDGSDFDRYCSANSVLGSASICSSVGNYCGIGGELSSEGHNSRGKSLISRLNGYGYFSDGGVETPRASGESYLDRMNASSRLNNNSNESSSSCYGRLGEDKGASSDADVENRKNGTHLALNIDSVMGIKADEDAFSQSKLSESEDSLLDYGTDSEGMIQYSERSFKHVNETKHGDVNPLFVSSSVVYGSNDWDEFMQDSAGGCLASVSLHLDQSFQYQDEHIGEDFEKILGDKAIASNESENSTVKDSQDVHYFSSVNHDAQVIDIHKQFMGSKYNVVNSHEAVAVEQTAMNSECANVLGLQNTLCKDNEEKCYLNSTPDGVERNIQSSPGNNGIDEASEKTFKGESQLSVSTISSHRAPLLSYSRLEGANGENTTNELDDKLSCLLPLNNISDGSGTQRDQGNDPSSTQLAKVDVRESEVSKCALQIIISNAITV